MGTVDTPRILNIPIGTEWFAASGIARCDYLAELKDYAHANVVPRIGAQRLQRLDEPQLLKLYVALLAEGRVKRDGNTEMFEYWSARVVEGETPKPLEVSKACGTTIHAARTALRRYKLGSLRLSCLGVSPPKRHCHVD
jgi:hypothetical protein